MYNFLAPLYRTGAGSNYEGYSSEEFETLLDEGAAAADRRRGDREVPAG